MIGAELITRLRIFDPHTDELEVVDEAADYIESLEVKLAKVMEALDYCINAPFSGWTIAQGYAGTILAEIKGK